MMLLLVCLLPLSACQGVVHILSGGMWLGISIVLALALLLTVVLAKLIDK
ncbi:MAG: hypothetical protein JST06_04230 [Bacteroidetes bacterium]|nr:hypothetical protein [Bacteroidota bacterium]